MKELTNLRKPRENNMKELTNLRKPREKHFLETDGTVKAYMYDEDILVLV